ncbi:DUF2218 domain-containing protein [Limimaricola cinnabarinus]|uniref:2,4-dihydroxyhept-2-ene-1,7-dioic acid aldolase n=1 Tax=Limimaricola cinnabarinus TaxID=1125964 RepID=A0A2G1MD49_9RHOB|nr:DUF2218 domain-containing protein [Limimaricola cinnabarinus]PHP26592.1 2,4-dihydroxyhept-2-ene-1,7-dioic acid aldolase [Limimaricola cinnabarinus]
MQDGILDEGRFRTPNASRYLQQLCKHFAHKVEASYGTHDGRVAMPFGPLRLTATDEELIVRLSVETAEARDRARAVIDDHLARFAHREGFERMAWHGPASLSRD